MRAVRILLLDVGQYITEEQAATAYGNLEEFARRYSHYYLGTGPYFLQGVFTVEGQAVLANNPDHPDASNRWDRFGPPAVPEIVMVTNANDRAVSPVAIEALVKDWKESGASNLETYEFPAELELTHDLISPDHPYEQVDKVYPILLQLIAE